MKPKISKIRSSRSDYIVHTFRKNLFRNSVSVVIGAILVLNIAGAYAQPSSPPPGGDVNATFSNLNVDGSLSIGGGISTPHIKFGSLGIEHPEDPFDRNVQVRSPLELASPLYGKGTGPVEIDDDLEVSGAIQPPYDQSDVDIDGNLALSTDDNIYLRGSGFIRNVSSGGKVHINDSNGTEIEGDVHIDDELVVDGGLRVNGGFSDPDDGDLNISDDVRLQLGKNYGDYFQVWRSTGNQYTSGSLSSNPSIYVSCPPSTVLTSCGGLVYSSRAARLEENMRRYTLADGDIYDEDFDACWTTYRFTGQSGYYSARAQAICFDPSGVLDEYCDAGVFGSNCSSLPRNN